MVNLALGNRADFGSHETELVEKQINFENRVRAIRRKSCRPLCGCATMTFWILRIDNTTNGRVFLSWTGTIGDVLFSVRGETNQVRLRWISLFFFVRFRASFYSVGPFFGGVQPVQVYLEEADRYQPSHGECRLKTMTSPSRVDDSRSSEKLARENHRRRK